MYKRLVLHTTTTHAGKIRYLSKGGKNNESERHTGCCFVLLAFQASRLKNEVAGIPGYISNVSFQIVRPRMVGANGRVGIPL